MDKSVQDLIDELGLNTFTNPLNQKTLVDYAFQYKGKIRPNSNYDTPSIQDIHSIKNNHSLTTNDIARFCLISSRTASKWVSPPFHEQSKIVPASAWQALLEALEIKERMEFKPRYPDIRTEVYETSARPTKHEFWQLLKMSMLNKKKISELSKISFEKICKNSVRGELEFENFSFVEQVSGRKLKTSSTDFSFNEWLILKPIICPAKIYHAPKIRASVISKVSDFDVNKKEQNLNESNKKVIYSQLSLKRSTPYYLDTDEKYTPPNKQEFLAVMIFVGISITEIALIMSCTKSKIERIIKGENRPSFYEWRRLLEVFNLSSRRNI